MRFTASHEPLAAPYFSKASNAYWEQVGMNLQLGFVSGEIFF